MAYYDGWKPYVPVAERRRKAALERARLEQKGRRLSPVQVSGRIIARTFWGRSWCTNLERYSDYANRLPRGRTYVRNGSVIDLQIAPGKVSALVSGSRIYKVSIGVAAVPEDRWASLCADCAGAIDSLVELLQGKFSEGVMERICKQRTGLFPSPAEIRLSCSCPDWATMCKHVAAVLYGVGARLDEQPELLFVLRQVDHGELIAQAGSGLPLTDGAPAADKVLVDDDLSALFGLELAGEDEPDGAQSAAAKGGKAAAEGGANGRGKRAAGQGGRKKAAAGRGQDGEQDEPAAERKGKRKGRIGGQEKAEVEKTDRRRSGTGNRGQVGEQDQPAAERKGGRRARIGGQEKPAAGSKGSTGGQVQPAAEQKGGRKSRIGGQEKPAAGSKGSTGGQVQPAAERKGGRKGRVGGQEKPEVEKTGRRRSGTGGRGKVAETPSQTPASKPARCSHPGCKLTARPHCDGLCYIHFKMRSD